MVAHSALTGADLHEVKGAAAASANTILKADGLGSASFVLPTTLTNISFDSVITNSQTADINPAVVDVPVSATFASNQANSDVDMPSSGIITLLTAGVYHTTFNLNFGRTTGAGNAIVAARLLLNGTQFGFTQSMTLSDANFVGPAQFNIIRAYAANDTIQVQIMRDSAGINNGGLRATGITVGAWSDVPSYWVRVAKLTGAA